MQQKPPPSIRRMLYLFLSRELIIEAGMSWGPSRFCGCGKKTSNRSANGFAGGFCCKMPASAGCKAIVAKPSVPSRLAAVHYIAYGRKLFRVQVLF